MRALHGVIAFEDIRRTREMSSRKIARSAASSCSLVFMLGASLALSSVAYAGDWGSGQWGSMVWGTQPVPVLPFAALLGLAVGLLVGAASGLGRFRRRGRALSRGGKLALAGLAFGIPLSAYAATISLPNSFTNGSVADADEVNANFSVLTSESNAQDGRLDGHDASITSLTNEATAQDARLDDHDVSIASLDSSVATLSSELTQLRTNVCVFQTTCAAGLVDRGLAGFIHQNVSGTCPFSQGAAFNPDFTWCHPRLCCTL